MSEDRKIRLVQPRLGQAAARPGASTTPDDPSPSATVAQGAHSAAEIYAFVQGIVSGEIGRDDTIAWLKDAYERTLSRDEAVALTRAMTRSGKVMSWGDGPELIDKHSTGGVGDKVSLVLAPLWAELGFRVPMLSGRGLGLTGGTLDKLESIPGFRTDLDASSLSRILDDVGCFITGQTTEIAPADRILYALRNETSTVDSIPLIVASILSKKLAAGVKRLHLDVKVGSGAFMRFLPDAQDLARMLVDVGSDAGLDCRAWITEMGRPLGRTVGNALEVKEAVDCLKGGGPDDLRAVVLRLADHPRAASALSSGAAFERFKRMVEAQGGDPATLDSPRKLLGGGVQRERVLATQDGTLHHVDAGMVGEAVFALGAGRRRAGDPVDFGVGVKIVAHRGERVANGSTVFRVYHRDGKGLEEAMALLQRSIHVVDRVPEDMGDLFHDEIRG